MPEVNETKTVNVADEELVNPSSGEIYTITHVEVTLSRTVKVAEYQYLKPSVGLRAQVQAPEMLNVVTEELYDIAAHELGKVVSKEIKHHARNEEYRSLLSTLRQHNKGSVEYRLIEEKLVTLNPNFKR